MEVGVTVQIWLTSALCTCSRKVVGFILLTQATGIQRTHYNTGGDSEEERGGESVEKRSGEEVGRCGGGVVFIISVQV